MLANSICLVSSDNDTPRLYSYNEEEDSSSNENPKSHIKDKRTASSPSPKTPGLLCSLARSFPIMIIVSCPVFDCVPSHLQTDFSLLKRNTITPIYPVQI